MSIDAETAEILREHRKRQNADRLRLGESWKGTDDYVFTTGWGEPIYPDTVSSLMPVLIKAYNDTKPKKPLPLCSAS